MIDLRQRSSRKELMDRDDIPFADMAQTLRELNIVNTRLGGHAITLQGIRALEGTGELPLVCEIGCGGGDNLFAIHRHYARKNRKARFIGIDMNPECIAFARQQYPQLDCQWICSDYAKVDFGEQRPGIIFSSLFCHHFTNDQLVYMLQWLQRNATKGFFINDLQRHWLAYYLIRYITKWFSRSYLVKNDACISVARSFRRNEWEQLFQQAGLRTPQIRWRWAFRFLVTAKTTNDQYNPGHTAAG